MTAQTNHLAFIDIPDAAWSLIARKTPAQSLADLIDAGAIPTQELLTFGYLITAIYQQPGDLHVGHVTYWPTGDITVTLDNGDMNYLIGQETTSAPPSPDQVLAIWRHHFEEQK